MTPLPHCSGSLLVVENVTAGYGGDPVLEGVSVGVDAGLVVSIVGANGSGKSTLLKAILGTIRVTAGSVRLAEKEITNWTTDHIVQEGVGYVPQLDDVFFPLTVQENLSLGGYRLPKHDSRVRAGEVLELFPPLTDKLRRIAGTLSGGERKMLAIARALMPRPRLLILDEPTANLAPIVATALLTEEVPRLVAQGLGLLLVEQRAKEALRVCDTGYIMVNGRIGYEAPGRELASRDDIGELFLGGPGRQGVGQSCSAG